MSLPLDATVKPGHGVHGKIILGGFKTSPSAITHNISKYVEELNETINQVDLNDNHRALHTTATEHTFFESIWNIHQYVP